MNGLLLFIKTAWWKLSTMENPYTQNHRFSEHLVKLDDQTSYFKILLDEWPVSIIIDSSTSITNHARKNENVTFW